MKTIRSLSALALLLLPFTPLTLQATRGPILPIVELIAGKGDPANYNDLCLVATGPASINAAGNVAARVLISGSSNPRPCAGIAILRGTTSTIYAKAGAQDPLTGGTFSKFSDPVMSSLGAFAFLGTVKTGGTINGSNDTGIYVYNPLTDAIIRRVAEGQLADTGTSFPEPMYYKSFSQIAINYDAGITFLASIQSRSGRTTKALFATDQGGTIRMIVAIGKEGFPFTKEFTAFAPVRFVSGQSRTLDEASGNVAVLGRFGDNSARSIGMAVSGSTGFESDDYATVGDPVPGLSGVTLKSVGQPIVNARGTLAFYATLSGSNVKGHNNAGLGLITSSGGGLTLRTGDPVPDTTGSLTSQVFTKFSDPVLNFSDAIAFIGTVKTGGTTGATGSNDTGIWVKSGDSMRCVVRENDPAPTVSGSSEGSFDSFKEIVLPNWPGPVFLATVRGVQTPRKTGLWAISPGGGVVPVIRTGDSLDFHGIAKIVKSITVFPQAPSSIGQSRSIDVKSSNLVFQVVFKDGSWGIYRSLWPDG